MSLNPVSAGGRAEAAAYKLKLLGQLGLRADATDAEVEAAHSGLVEFLELAPHGVKAWATARTAEVDEAFALLSGPEQDLVPPAQPAVMAQEGPATTPPPVPAAPATYAAPTAPVARKARRTPILAGIGAVIAAGLVFGVYQMGQAAVPGIDGAPTGQETTAAPAAGATAVPVDKAKVSALMKKIAANPKDIASLQGLGDIYFASSDYKTAGEWEKKILAVDPKNQIALLASGAAEFNLGNAAAAEKQWLVAAKYYPDVAEVHYDLGFLYMSQTPPDTAKMTAEWKKVVAIDPTSELAKTVTQHLGSSTPTTTPSAK